MYTPQQNIDCEGIVFALRGTPWRSLEHLALPAYWTRVLIFEHETLSREPKLKGRALLQILISRAVHRGSPTIDQAPEAGMLASRLAGGSGSIDRDSPNAPKKRVTGREFIAVAGGVCGCLVIGAYAQQPAMPVIGFPP
jgi:hypothetical protein